MANRILQLIEAHLEKGVLSLAALFMLYVAWGYLIGSPNKVEFQGRKLGPTQLYREVKGEAEALDRAVSNATPEPVEAEEFAERLENLHEGGVFASTGEKSAPFEPELPRITTFGDRIEVPGLEEFDQPPDSVEIVSPLKPKDLVVTTGHSMVYRTPLEIGPAEESLVPPEAEAQEPEPQEVAWVTIAGYYDKKAQFTEMEKSGYAGFRARAYVAGLEVERQELLASGEWSKWGLISNTKAMPDVQIPEPIFDDREGTLVNKEEIDQAFTLIKQEQPRIMQPPFYVVDDGDEWVLPPLEGLEIGMAGEGEEPVVAAAQPRVGDEGLRPGPGLRPPTGGRPGGSRGPYGGGRGPYGGGRGGLRPGGTRGGGVAPPRDDKAETRRWASEQLTEAKKAIAQKDFDAARRIAETIMGRENVTRGQQRDAEKIIKYCDRQQQRAEARASLVADRSLIPVNPIRQPETRAHAVWFHDDTVEPGKTYRYRMRVRLWNRYVGQLKPVKNEENARKAVIVGDWSLPTRPVTVPPGTYFFVRGGGLTGEETASVEVWKWRKGRWMSETFEVRVGDVIGQERRVRTDEFNADLEPVYENVDFSTGAVLLDLRPQATFEQRIPRREGFGYRDQESLVIVYLDPVDGQVKEKAAILDAYDPIRKQLEEEEL